MYGYWVLKNTFFLFYSSRKTNGKYIKCILCINENEPIDFFFVVAEFVLIVNISMYIWI